MTDALQRTVRRGIALLLVPLSLLVLQVGALVDAQAYGSGPPALATFLLPVALLLGSLVYLAGSWLASGAGPPEPPEDETAEEEDLA